MARPRRPKPKESGRRTKKKVSILNTESIEYVDWKDVNLLRRFQSDRAKIRARRVTGNNTQQQRQVAVAIRSAREMALLPYTNRVTTHRGGGGGRGEIHRITAASVMFAADNMNKVLDEAVQTLGRWLRAGIKTRVNVNVSARQLEHGGDLALQVENALICHGVPADALCLEITEHQLVRDLDHTTVELEKLRRLGVRVALDDFGTGYSSLSYLQHFAVDRLKIDRSFLADSATPDWESHGIIAAVIALARHLKADVVAEGIETSTELARVEALGCDFGQGYYFARPMRPKPVASLLELALPPADVA